MIIEHIEWLDAKTLDGWITASEVEMQLATVVSVGFVVGETPTILCVAGTAEVQEEQYSSLTMIPKHAIQARKQLDSSAAQSAKEER